MIPWLVGFVLLAALAAAAGAMLQRKAVGHWLGPAAGHGLRTFFIRRPEPVHVLFCLVDHWEPHLGRVGHDQAAERVQRWIEGWPEVAAAHHDADGRPPQHTWFYPWDEWHDGELAALSRLCYDGLGEIELHLHHRDDTSDSLRAKLEAAVEAFGHYGALVHVGRRTTRGYGFIHGDWALDNSHPQGRFCGVNDELRVLAATGCYADFTLPTPDRTQPRTVNVIYRATDDPERPRSHDQGRRLTARQDTPGDLLLIPGPLGINLWDWQHRFYPSIEQAEITAVNPATPARLRFWLRCGVGVEGRPDWVFIKTHTHGCFERDHEAVLGRLRHAMHELLEQRCNDGRRFVLHYCTARELYNLARAAEQGFGGDPNEYRDHELAPPVNSQLRSATPVEVAALCQAEGKVANVGAGPVEWHLKVGPVARIAGPVQRLTWHGRRVYVKAEGEYEIERRA